MLPTQTSGNVAAVAAAVVECWEEGGRMIVGKGMPVADSRTDDASRWRNG